MRTSGRNRCSAASLVRRAGLGAVVGLVGVWAPQAGGQSTAATLFEDGRMLRPLVQDVLEGSALISHCDPASDDPMGLVCHFVGVGQSMDLALAPLLDRVQAPDADPKAEILSFANAVLIAGDPDRVYPQRTNLRPLVRAAADVARAREEERLPDAALFPVPGFPAAVAFAVRDDATAVHLVLRGDDPVLGLTDFDAVKSRARINARWATTGQAKLRCGKDDPERYCRVEVDGFYEPSVVFDPGFGDWLALRVGEPSLLAIPSRDELLVARLSDPNALLDLEKRLKQRRPYAITHEVAYWAGAGHAPLEPVERWALRGGMLLPMRVTVRLVNGTVISTGF